MPAIEVAGPDKTSDAFHSLLWVVLDDLGVLLGLGFGGGWRPPSVANIKTQILHILLQEFALFQLDAEVVLFAHGRDGHNDFWWGRGGGGEGGVDYPSPSDR